MLDDLSKAEARAGRGGRPFVTLAWAQSLDGSIAVEAGKRHAFSGPETLALTHALRAAHDVILVGIGTLLADDPALTVRLWEGPSPSPVVLDSRLRTPDGARLLAGVRRRVRIVCTPAASAGDRARLAARGAEIVQVPAWPSGWVDLERMLAALGAAGVRRVMVEGGAAVLTSFLRAQLADHAVVTIAPCLVGGLAAVGTLDRAALPRIAQPRTHRLADDLIVNGGFDWGAS